MHAPVAQPPTSWAATDQSGLRRVLVLGLGNDILCDDAVGLVVAAAVGERLADRPEITALASPEMGLSLLDLVEGYDALVIVDAVQTGAGAAGTVHELTPDDLEVVPRMSPHFLGVGDVLALGRHLGICVPERVRIFAIEVEDARTLGTELTAPVRGAISGIVDRVARAAIEMAGAELVTA